MSEHWLYINGKKHYVPSTAHEAQQLGWHHGTDYQSLFVWKNESPGVNRPTHDDVIDWCQDNFDPHVYRALIHSVWFLYEEDALACKLRWS